MLKKTIIILLFILLCSQVPATLRAAEADIKTAQDLINGLGCKACHKLAGEGGNLAPELDHIGSRLTRSQIGQHLAAHMTPNDEAFMPSYNTSSPAGLKLLSDFLYNLQ